MNTNASPALIEPIVIPDTFCTGLGKVEFVTTELVRLTFYADQLFCGEPERVIVERVILPATLVPIEWLDMTLLRPAFDGVVYEASAIH